MQLTLRAVSAIIITDPKSRRRLAINVWHTIVSSWLRDFDLALLRAFWVVLTVLLLTDASIARSADQLLWDSVKNQNHIGTLQLFLEIYPDSPYAAEARLKLDALAKGSGIDPDLPRWEGFLKLADAPLPQTIGKTTIEKSVFQIETFGNAGSDQDMEVVPLAKIKGDPLKGRKRGTERYFRGMQLANCKRQKLPKCPIFKLSRSEVVTATAFAVTDQQTFGTALHAVQNWYYTIARYNPHIDPYTLTMPFSLYDRRKRLIYNSETNRIGAKLKRVDKKNWLLRRYMSDEVRKKSFSLANEFNKSDYAEFGFSANIFSEYLEYSTKEPAIYAQVYAFGYPDVDQFYTRFENIRATKNVPTGYALSATAGKITLQLAYQAMCLGMASFHGGSGSPVLNAEGRVVGVNSLISDDPSADLASFYSLLTRVPNDRLTAP